MNFRTVSRVLLICLVLCTAIAVAQDPSTIFQLNGDSANDSLTCTYGPCDYWNLINQSGSSGSGRGQSLVNSFIPGAASTLALTGGHTKDALPLSGWQYSSTSTPPKDGLNAGYAAAYNVTDFDIIFGADRYEGSGDANIGIWFFQNSVTLNGTGGFNGSHANGDVFIISAFVNGGGTPQIAVYSWDQPGLANAITSNDGQAGCSKASNNNPQTKDCAAANLLVLVPLGSDNCTSGNYACAISNGATVNATWASYNTPSNTITSPYFFSGGIDITKAFAAVGAAAPCFASFLEETRSSQSVSAVLKDFLLGGFPVCSMSITKSCGSATVNSGGTSITYPVGGSVTNSGIGTLYNVQVNDCIAGSFNSSGVCSGTLDTISLGNIASKQSVPWSDSSTSTSSTQSDQAFAIAATTSGGLQTLQSTNTATASCSLAVSTTLTVSKSCTTTLQVSGGQVAVQVAYGGQVCNTGPSQITGITLTDYPDSAVTSGGNGATVASGITLGPGTTAAPTCKTYGPFTYNPSLIDQTVLGGDGIAGDGAGRYFFTDLIDISSATAAVGGLTKVSSTDSRTNGGYGFATASCPICNGSGECAP